MTPDRTIDLAKARPIVYNCGCLERAVSVSHWRGWRQTRGTLAAQDRDTGRQGVSSHAAARGVPAQGAATNDALADARRRQEPRKETREAVYGRPDEKFDDKVSVCGHDQRRTRDRVAGLDRARGRCLIGSDPLASSRNKRPADRPVGLLRRKVGGSATGTGPASSPAKPCPPWGGYRGGNNRPPYENLPTERQR